MNLRNAKTGLILAVFFFGLLIHSELMFASKSESESSMFLYLLKDCFVEVVLECIFALDMTEFTVKVELCFGLVHNELFLGVKHLPFNRLWFAGLVFSVDESDTLNRPYLLSETSSSVSDISSSSSIFGAVEKFFALFGVIVLLTFLTVLLFKCL